MTLEKVGFFAVIENFNEYISEVRTMQNEHQKLGASQKGVEESSRSTGAALGGLASALAVAAAGYISLSTISGAIEKTTEMGEATHQLQLVTGATAEQASGLIAALHEVGVAPEAAIASFGIFERNLINTLDAMKQGKDVTTPFATSLAALNVKVLDASGNLRPFHDILLDAAESISKLSTAEEQTARASDLFGRNGRVLLPILLEGKQGILDMEAAAKKLGVTLSQDNVNAIHQYVVESRAADEAISGLKLKLALELLPTLTALATYFAEHADDIRHWVDVAISALGQLVKYVGQPIADAIAGFKAIRDGIADVADFISDLAHGRWAEAWSDLKSVALDILHLLLVDVAAMFGFLPNLIIDAVNVAIREVNKIKIPEIDIAGRNVVPGAGGGPNIPQIPQIFPSFELPSLPKATAQVKEHAQAIQDEGNAAAGAAKEDADLKKAIDDVKAGTISYKDALKLGLSATQAGMLEAEVALANARDAGKEKAFNYIEALTEVAAAYQKNIDVARQLTLTQAEKTQTSIEEAAASIFSQPSREMLALRLQSDQLQLALDKASGSMKAATTTVEGLYQVGQKLSGPVHFGTGQSSVPGATQFYGGPSAGDLDKQKKAVDALIKQEEDTKKVLKDEFDSANRLNPTIDEQYKTLHDNLIPEYGLTTQAVADLKTKLGMELNPKVEAATTDFQILQADLHVLNDPDHMKGLLDKSFNAKSAFDSLTTAVGAATTKLSELAQKDFFSQAGTTGAGAGIAGGQPHIKPPDVGGGGILPGAVAFDVGGFTTQPTAAHLSVNARPEVVLPLTDQPRSRELLSMLPPSLLASIMPQGGGMTFAPSINITATDFESAVQAAHVELDRRAYAARRTFNRSGALIGGGIG